MNKHGVFNKHETKAIELAEKALLSGEILYAEEFHSPKWSMGPYREAVGSEGFAALPYEVKSYDYIEGIHEPRFFFGPTAAYDCAAFVCSRVGSTRLRECVV